MSSLVIAVVGLGYVGLPLVVEFGKRQRTIGFDISSEKVQCCQQGIDPSHELTIDQMRNAKFATYTNDPTTLSEADIIIIAVPTPVDDARIPNFRPLISASSVVGEYLKPGSTVIYESTVYPGATEEICAPILAQKSGLEWKKDFYIGYSPERINPGDREHTLTNVLKVVSGDSAQTLDIVAQLYESIVRAGVYRASSIKIAEAAKVIENTQRDLNIALMNELAIIFDRIGLDTSDVLDAAATKWNFLNFRPGLVGGHCIGVDPYYLTHKAEMYGYHPQVILAGRRINDGMGKFIAEQTVKQMIANGCNIKGAKVNIFGLAFKENCADLRNSKVIDIAKELQTFGINVFIYDPYVDKHEAIKEYQVDLSTFENLPVADAVIVAVAHEEFLVMPNEKLFSKVINNGVFIDVKAKFNRQILDDLGLRVWRL